MTATRVTRQAAKPAMADKAAHLVQQKLAQGWIPAPGSFLQVDATAEKPWWKFW